MRVFPGLISDLLTLPLLEVLLRILPQHVYALAHLFLLLPIVGTTSQVTQLLDFRGIMITKLVVSLFLFAGLEDALHHYCLKVVEANKLQIT